MSIEAMKLALEALEMFCEHGAILRPLETVETLRQAIEQFENYPPECQTEAEKTAFAFGWFKALEKQRKG